MKSLVRLIWISIFLLIGVNNLVYAFDDIELVGQIPGGLQRYIGRVTVVGNYAYIATGEDLRIVDVSTPSVPAEVGFYQTPALDVTVVGSYAYVAGDGLHVFDVSTPSSPSEVGFYQAFGVDVAVVGSYAYIAGDGLHVVDVSTPSAPAEVGFYQTPAEEITSVTAVGSYAYITEGPTKGGLRIIDVSTPSAPAEVGFYQSPVGWGFGVNVVDSYAYFIVGSMGVLRWPDPVKDGLSIVDVSTPSAPSEVGFCEIHDDVYWNGANITVVGGYAYIAGGKGLRVFDVSIPSSPVEVGFYQTPGEATGVSVSDDLIYVADDKGGMSILRYTGRVTAISSLGKFITTWGQMKSHR